MKSTLKEIISGITTINKSLLIAVIICTISIPFIYGESPIIPDPVLDTIKHPLDAAYETDIQEWTTNEEFEVVINKYTELWTKELHNSYERLLQILDRKHKKILKDSQESWEKHIKLKKNFMFNTLYKTKFDNLVGREGYFHIKIYLMMKIRERALELNTYLYYLDNNER